MLLLLGAPAHLAVAAAAAPLAWLRYSYYVLALTPRDVAAAGRGATPRLREAVAAARRAAEALERRHA